MDKVNFTNIIFKFLIFLSFFENNNHTSLMYANLNKYYKYYRGSKIIHYSFQKNNFDFNQINFVFL